MTDNHFKYAYIPIYITARPWVDYMQMYSNTNTNTFNFMITDYRYKYFANVFEYILITFEYIVMK